MPLLKVENISAGYGRERVIESLSFHVNRGEIVSLLGPSGCGKTTALRAIAGFEPVSDGLIQIEQKTVSAPGTTVPPEQRSIGMVFQDYALFPHLTIADNIGFGLKKLPAVDRRVQVEHLLDATGLQGKGGRYPHELSGGQQQRVALARALAPRPTILLMDEPFSNLDIELRERLSVEVRDLLKAEGISGILVTHDQHEAFAVSDKVGVMREGRILQWDTPYNLYHEPANRFVADFVGQGALVTGEVINDHQVEIELGVLNGHIPVECDASGCDECVRSCHVDVLLRPDDIVHDDDSLLLAEVENKAFRGAEFLYTLKLPSGQRALSLVPSHHNHAIGEKIGIKLAVDHVVAFRRD